MNVLIIYFSATGGTKYLASELGAAINARGHRCDLFNIEKQFDTAELWRINPVIPAYMDEAERRVPLRKKLKITAAAAGFNSEVGASFNAAVTDSDFISIPASTFTSAEVEAAGKNEFSAIARLNKKMENFVRYMSCFDLIGFGSPVYFFEPAAVFSSFVNSISVQMFRKKAFTFGAHMQGPVWFRENFKNLIESRGFEVIGHTDDYIIHTEFVPILPKFAAADNILKKYLHYRRPKIVNKIEKFLDSIGMVKNAKISSIVSLPFTRASIVERAIGRAVEKALYATMKLSIGSRILTEKCVKCGLCVLNCPMRLISMDPDTGYPVRNSHCMYCLRCINICPSGAISYTFLYDGRARFKGFDRL